MASLRSKEVSERYKRDRVAGEWDTETYTFDWQNTALQEFTHWALVPSNYPYDLIAEVHHLLVPKRVFPTYREVNEEEYEELKSIKDKLKDHYDFILENLPSKITISSHYHLHFIKMRTDI